MNQIKERDGSFYLAKPESFDLALIEKLQALQPFSPVNMPLHSLWTPEYDTRIRTREKIEALKVSLTQDKDYLKANQIMINVYPDRELCVIGGNARIIAAIEMGWEKIPLLVVSVPKETEMAWNLKHNKHSGEDNKEKEHEVLLELRDSGYDMNSLGYTPTQMVDALNMSGEYSVDPKSDPNYNGTTPSKELCCPACGYIGKKKDFKIKDKENE